MPIKRLVRIPSSATAAALKDRLLNEWRSPDPNARQPIILEEPARTSEPTHVYVIWDDWSDLDQVERSEIIMDAFEDRYGKDRACNVTVALGLTPAEAERMGIGYQ